MWPMPYDGAHTSESCQKAYRNRSPCESGCQDLQTFWIWNLKLANITFFLDGKKVNQFSGKSFFPMSHSISTPRKHKRWQNYK
jgi:hypothetical protein